MGTGGTKSTTGVTGNDSSSSFEALLNQMVNNQQDQALNNASTSIPNTDSKNAVVNGLDSISLQSQKAQQIEQLVMQQMMKIMSTQDASSSSSTGTDGSDDSTSSIMSSSNSNNDLTQLLQTIVQEQADTSATTNGLTNTNQVNAVLSNSNIKI